MTTDGDIDRSASADAAPNTPTQLSRTLILEATWQCLHEKGYDGTTIRRIATILDCSVGSIYRYFRDKHELLLAVTEGMLKPVHELLENGAGFETSVTEYHTRACNDPEAYRLMFWLAGAPAQRKRAHVRIKPGDDDGSDWPGAAPLPGVVRQIIDDWAHRLRDAALAHQCWSLLHGAIMLGQDSDQVLRMFRRLASPEQASRVFLPPTPEERFLQGQRTPAIAIDATAASDDGQAESPETVAEGADIEAESSPIAARSNS